MTRSDGGSVLGFEGNDDDVSDKNRPSRQKRPRRRRPRIALVLGAGGLAGAAYHAGTLLALETDFGWDPRTAEIIVGTSAGSITGALLRAGLTADDIAAWAASVPALAGRRHLRRRLDRIEALRPQVAPTVPRLRRPSSTVVLRALRRQDYAFTTMALSLLPHGWLEADATMQMLSTLIRQWPKQELWIPSVRLRDATRVVFAGGSEKVSVAQAVSASCAIPGLFRPVDIEGDHYMDGATHSPTNADVLADSGVDAVIVIAPMSAHRDALRNRPERFVRSRFARQLAVEQRQLERAGIKVFAFEPRVASLQAMGVNPLSRSNGMMVVRNAYFDASQVPEFAGLARLLAA